MAFERDHGTCCLVLPLKLGVGLICMLIFALSMLNFVALLTGDIRLQGNGYSLDFYRLPSIVGCFGFIFGFIGLLGVYDDKWQWLRIFNVFLVVKLLAMALACAADYWTLRSCEGWINSPTAETQNNPQMYVLSSMGVCPWARWSYLIGATLDIGFQVYITYCSVLYQMQLASNPPYALDFGLERYDVTGRWKFYQVTDPRNDYVPDRDMKEEKQPIIDVGPALGVQYGANQYGGNQQELHHYGPDGMDTIFTPADGPPPVQEERRSFW
mmetsp:Transcript_68870/g.149885  ORF Transcript_68870/g.149885 Transcript_68870/m.149885 type:complete len:269 (+) Transcript_68870:117-923(+)